MRRIALDNGITAVILVGVKTAISIPDPLFSAVEQVARRLGISRSEVFQRAVKEFLRNHRARGVTEALNEVYGEAGKPAAVDPVLRLLQGTSVREKW